MVIKIKNPITRELQLTGYIHKGKMRPVVVTMTSNETLVFRPKGTRHTIEVDLTHCITLAEIMSASARYQEEMDKFKKGLRKRKPKKCNFPYSPIFFKEIDSTKTKR